MVNKIAVGYIRCSTEQQEDSPEQQKIEILAFANLKGYQVTTWFVDFGKSGTTFEQRPEFLHLKSVVDNKPNFGVVICYDESRWGRAIDAEENTYWRVYFRQRGVQVILVKTSVDRDNEFAPMLSAFEGVQASQFSKKLSELTLRGAKNNTQYSNGGTAPYGYIRIGLNTKTDEERILQHGAWCVSGQEKVKWGLGDETEINTVHFIFEQRIKGLSCITIAQMLNEKNVPPPGRGRWRNQDRKWASSTIKSIIENPAYYGARAYNRNSMSKIQAKQKGRDLKHGVSYPHWLNDQSEWIITENVHDPIISKELWMKVNLPKSEKQRVGTPHNNVPYLLTGIIKCSRCGFAYQGQSSKIKGKSYFRYVCGGYNGKRVCDYFSVKKDLIEDFVIESIRQTIDEPSFITKVEKKLKAIVDRTPQGYSDEIKKTEKSVELCQRKIDNLIHAIEEGIKINDVKSRLLEIEGEKSNHVHRLEELNGLITSKNKTMSVIQSVEEFINGFKTEFENSSMPLRKLMITKCIHKIEIDPVNRIVGCYVHQLPGVFDRIGNHLGLNPLKNEKVSLLRTPFRKAVVAGAGSVPHLQFLTRTSLLRLNWHYDEFHLQFAEKKKMK